MRNPSLVIPYVEKDYLDEARGRYTMAFENKPVFDKIMQLITLEVSEIQSILKDLKQLRTLEEATGIYLDIIGEIVGQPRILLDVDFLEFFGMEGDPRAYKMGDLFRSDGGIFFDLNERMQGNVQLDDETYRIMIRAKIAKNSTRATPEDVMWYLNYVFGTNSSFASEGNANFIALISENLTPQQVMLLSYVNRTGSYDVTLFPKPIGVGVSYGFYDPEGSFSFDDVAVAKGFGDLDDPFVDGGVFASLIDT